MAGDEEESQVRCSNCVISFSEFREQGRLGCPTCYEEFREDLVPLLENIHEEAVHCGKRPVRSPSQSEDQQRLIQLRNQQNEAIEREDYEAAAKLRDEITELENSMLTKQTDS